jgi:hypothetical protein
MRGRLLGTLALALLVLLLGGLAWRDPQPPPGTAAPPLTALDPARVQGLTLLNGAGSEIRLTRQGAGWQMLTPYDLPADDQRIDQLLALAVTPSHARFDEPAARMAEFGLAPPKAVVWLDQVEVRFGGPHPLEELRFVASGGQIHLTEERFFHLLLLPAEAWVAPALLSEAGELVAIRTPTWDLQRDAAGGWRLEPEAGPAGRRRVRRRPGNGGRPGRPGWSGRRRGRSPPGWNCGCGTTRAPCTWGCCGMANRCC